MEHSSQRPRLGGGDQPGYDHTIYCVKRVLAMVIFDDMGGGYELSDELITPSLFPDWVPKSDGVCLSLT